MTPTNFIILMLCFGCIMVIWLWLFDGHKIDQEKRQEKLTKNKKFRNINSP